MVQKVARSSTDLKVRGSVPESFALLKPKLDGCISRYDVKGSIKVSETPSFALVQSWPKAKGMKTGSQ